MGLDLLGELARSHRDDKDSGEALVEHIRGILHGLPPRDRLDVEEELARLASDESDEMSGVALEVFAREGQSKSDVVFAIFRAAKSARWRDQLALALARMRARQFAEPLTRHISEVLDDTHSSGSTQLGYLHSIDASAFYELAVPYVARVFAADDEQRLTGLVPLYTSELSSDEGRPLIMFLGRLCEVDANAARRFAGLIRDYLSKPWSHERLGRATVDALQRRISAWSCE